MKTLYFGLGFLFALLLVVLFPIPKTVPAAAAAGLATDNDKLAAETVANEPFDSSLFDKLRRAMQPKRHPQAPRLVAQPTRLPEGYAVVTPWDRTPVPANWSRHEFNGWFYYIVPCGQRETHAEAAATVFRPVSPAE